MFDISGRVAVVTGGGGVLCSAMSKMLAKQGAKVVVLDISEEAAQHVVDDIKVDGGEGIAVKTDVLDKDAIQAAADQILNRFGQVDILINGAGGNHARATTTPEQPFFDIPQEAFQWVFNLNFIGTVLPSQVFGKIMAEQKRGVILNTSSMTSLRPLTRVVAYGNAKGAVNNFTAWLAVHMAQEYAPDIRVNAIAPGFFLTEQNRYLLYDADTGDYTARGQQVVDHTPMARFGDPSDLLGTVLWLISDSSSFVTGIVVPIDGGFAAYSGV